MLSKNVLDLKGVDHINVKQARVFLTVAAWLQHHMSCKWVEKKLKGKLHACKTQSEESNSWGSLKAVYKPFGKMVVDEGIRVFIRSKSM